MDYMLELIELSAAVQAMRSLQNEYFKTKSTVTLFKAKEAERAVDVKIAAILTRIEKGVNGKVVLQGDLF